MTDAARQRMTADEFLIWCLDQEDTYELVEGVPVLKFDNGPELMAGASAAHDQIVVNLISRLREKLRGRRCRVKTADQAARMERGNMRRPDATIDCGAYRPESYESAEPTAFFEVLSPSTRRMDLLRKSDEYRSLPSARHFAFIEPHQPLVLLWSRTADGDWRRTEVSDVNDALELIAVDVRLTLQEIYEDVEFAPDA